MESLVKCFPDLKYLPLRDIQCDVNKIILGFYGSQSYKIPGHCVDPARVVWRAGQVSAENCTHQCQGQNHENADRRDGQLQEH